MFIPRGRLTRLRGSSLGTGKLGALAAASTSLANASSLPGSTLTTTPT
jgi:hypothetical protein